MKPFIALAAALMPVSLAAQPAPPPRLIVAIAVDQFSADLFTQYRPHFTGGLKRLANGVVFPSAYQSHAATETCPGHSTILSGVHPARSGIVANNWVDPASTRADKRVYCAEDETVPGSTFRAYTPSPAHLLVPTLGERMKTANPASRSVAVAGKDRAAIMMGGKATDAIWFLDPFKKRSFVTLKDHATSRSDQAGRVNSALDRLVGRSAASVKLTPRCAELSRKVRLTETLAVGDGRFARAADDADAFRASPALDAATLDMAGGLIASLKLGRGAAPDLIAIGLSATDYVGHRYGTEGSEMCLQLTALDAMLGAFFKRLDAGGLDYAVVLTADHGGHDTPERNRENAIPEAARIAGNFSFAALDKQLAAELGVTGPVVLSADLGDLWFVPSLTAAQRARAEARAIALLNAQPSVAAVFTRADMAATAIARTPPESWTLADRARASYHPARSGDLIVLLRPRVTPIPEAGVGYIATHGSPWDYDRRVPLLFWRKGLKAFEQPNSVEVIDIAPTLAALVGLSLPASETDGRCLDLIAGSASSCR